jgi:hypothetical protein
MENLASGTADDCVTQNAEVHYSASPISNEDHEFGDVEHVADVFEVQPQPLACEQHPGQDSFSLVVEVHGLRCCALVDTGAQISSINQDIVESSRVNLHVSDIQFIRGIGGVRSPVLGRVELEIELSANLKPTHTDRKSVV